MIDLNKALRELCKVNEKLRKQAKVAKDNGDTEEFEAIGVEMEAICNAQDFLLPYCK